MNLLELIGFASLIQSLTWARPIMWIRERLGLIGTCSGWRSTLIEFVSCPMCMAFWFGAFYYQDLSIAGLMMLFAKLIDWMYDSIPVKIS